MGTTSGDFFSTELARIGCALHAHGESAAPQINAALAVLDGARPKDEVEAMLVSEMAVTHGLAMDLLGRAKRAEEIPQFESAGNMAVKLLRTFTAQTEALAKLRRGGEQTVRVEHVHVHPGGQAIVGNVTSQPNEGGGGSKENVGQPHATDPRALKFAPGVQMWSADAARTPVPVTSSEREAPLPDARRRRR
jgi:hypothetical protein